MVKPANFIILFLILCFGLVSFCLIFKIFSPKPEQSKNSDNAKTILPGANLQTGQEANNLTDAFGEFLSEKLKSSGQSFSTLTKNIKELIPKELLDVSSVEKTLNLFPEINEADLKISQDTSKINQTKYLKTIVEVSQKYVKNFNIDKPILDVLNEIVKKQDAASAQKIAEGSKILVKELYKITVPSNWLDFHKKIIAYFISNQIIHEAIAGYNDDPIKSYLAVRAIPKISSAAIEIEDLLTKKVLENKIDLSKII